MLDIETLGTDPNSVILTIAACAFDPFSDAIYDQYALYHRIDTESQPTRVIDEHTLAWWAKQSIEAQNEALAEENRIPLSDSLEELAKLIWKSDITWANGVSFDMTILENAYKSLNMTVPWQYYRVMDARTVYTMNPDHERLENNHHAFKDVINQITLLQRTFKKLGVKSLG
jgi:hypothetical protein